jgi:ubiquitin-protein ligase
MAYWYNRYPDRFRTEVTILRHKTYARFRWRDQKLIADDSIIAGGRTFHISIVYPNGFPSEPPAVKLLTYGLPEGARAHRYASGDLCLWDPQTWSPTLTGAWVHARAVLWCNSMFVFLTTGHFPQPTRPRTRSHEHQ